MLGITVVSFVALLWQIYRIDMGNEWWLVTEIKRLPYGDKIAHFGVFGGLALLMNISFRFHTLNLGVLRFYTGALLVAVFATVEECSQYYLPTRTFDVGDLVADAAGILLASLISWVIACWLARRSPEDSVAENQPST